MQTIVPQKTLITLSFMRDEKNVLKFRDDIHKIYFQFYRGLIIAVSERDNEENVFAFVFAPNVFFNYGNIPDKT